MELYSSGERDNKQDELLKYRAFQRAESTKRKIKQES